MYSGHEQVGALRTDQ